MQVPISPDKTIPLPESLEPEAAGTLRENMQIAANTADLIHALGGRSDNPDVVKVTVHDAGKTNETDEAETDASSLEATFDATEVTGSAQVADDVFKAFAQRAQAQFDEAMAEAAEPAKPKRGRPRKHPIVEKPSANPPELYQGNVAERISAMLREYNNPIVADAAELRQVTINKLLDLSMCGDPRIEIKATELLGKVSDVGLFTEKTEITVTYNTTADLDRMIKDKVRKMLTANAVDITPISLDIDKEMGFEEPKFIEAPPAEPLEVAPPAEESPDAP